MNVVREKFQPLAILVSILVVVVVAYLAAWKSRSKIAQRAGSLMVGAIAGCAAFVAAVFAINALPDFSSHLEPLWETVLGEAIMISIAVGLGLFAIRSLRR